VCVCVCVYVCVCVSVCLCAQGSAGNTCTYALTFFELVLRGSAVQVGTVLALPMDTEATVCGQSARAEEDRRGRGGNEDTQNYPAW